jgi:hypothetical protein
MAGGAITGEKEGLLIIILVVSVSIAWGRCVA